MNRNFRTAKTSVVIGILVVIIFTAFMPATSALFQRLGEAYECVSHINIDYDIDAALAPFLPVDRVKNIPINVNYRVTGYYVEEILPSYEIYDNYIYLSVEETPEWCSAAIIPSLLLMKATTSWTSKNATLSIQVNENAPAFSEGKIKIKVEVDNLGSVKGGTFYQDVTFKPGYLPILSITAPKGTSKLIGPDDTANFDIEIKNLGNAKTEILCSLLDLPEGWIATIDSNTVIGSSPSGDNPKATLQLVIKPPYGFGYHNDREVIQVSITPSYFNDPSLSGKEYILSFVIQSRGFSTPGFDAVFVLFALIGIAFIAKKRQKIGGARHKIPKEKDNT